MDVCVVCRFMGLALPGGIMVGLEAWSFDWTMVLAAHFVRRHSRRIESACRIHKIFVRSWDTANE